MTSYEPWSAERASEIIAAHAGGEGPTLPILHAVQDAFGFVPEAVEPMIAEALNLSRAEIHGVVTFYHDFRRKPAGCHVLKLCRAEACQSMGGTTADGRVTLEPTYCLGLCATAPSAMLDGRLVGRLDVARLDRLLSEAQR